MPNLYEKYAAAFWNTDGTVDNIKFNIPDNFNFGYEVIDVLEGSALTNPR